MGVKWFQFQLPADLHEIFKDRGWFNVGYGVKLTRYREVITYHTHGMHFYPSEWDPACKDLIFEVGSVKWGTPQASEVFARADRAFRTLIRAGYTVNGVSE